MFTADANLPRCTRTPPDQYKHTPQEWGAQSIRVEVYKHATHGQCLYCAVALMLPGPGVGVQVGAGGNEIDTKGY
jgi:hypothetical protein